MKLNIRAVVLTALSLYATTATADQFDIVTYCNGATCNSQGVWASSFGYSGHFNANEGCRSSPGPSGMLELCMDWGNARGHFYFIDQPKRCIARSFVTRTMDLPQIWFDIWDEVGCAWRMADPQTLTNVTESPAATVPEVAAPPVVDAAKVKREAAVITAAPAGNAARAKLFMA